MDPRSPYTLVGVDIAGEWNRPLLVNAARLSDCSCAFARSDGFAKANKGSGGAPDDDLEVLLQGFQRIVACEATKKSVGLYDFPAPREQTAVLVGNEEAGLPRAVLKRADSIVSIPMACSALSSLNVAVAGAIVLYALTRDLGRRKQRRSTLRLQGVDVLIQASADPHELGSLLRSVYAFGWRRVFLSDPHRIWFTEDPRVILAGRAAARRARNLLAVLPVEKLESPAYDAMLVCDPGEPGMTLSRLQLPECRRLLVVIGSGDSQAGCEISATSVTVDFVDRSVTARTRHAGSILLSVVASMLDT